MRKYSIGHKIGNICSWLGLLSPLWVGRVIISKSNNHYGLYSPLPHIFLQQTVRSWMAAFKKSEWHDAATGLIHSWLLTLQFLTDGTKTTYKHTLSHRGNNNSLKITHFICKFNKIVTFRKNIELFKIIFCPCTITYIVLIYSMSSVPICNVVEKLCPNFWLHVCIYTHRYSM